MTAVCTVAKMIRKKGIAIRPNSTATVPARAAEKRAMSFASLTGRCARRIWDANIKADQPFLVCSGTRHAEGMTSRALLPKRYNERGVLGWSRSEFGVIQRFCRSVRAGALAARGALLGQETM